MCLQAAKEELVARQAEESRFWDTLRFEEAMQKVQYFVYLVRRFFPADHRVDVSRFLFCILLTLYLTF